MISKPACQCWMELEPTFEELLQSNWLSEGGVKEWKAEGVTHWRRLQVRQGSVESWRKHSWFFCPHCGTKAFVVTPNALPKAIFTNVGGVEVIQKGDRR